mmetsp:Transcript_49583/g.91466  ORF Transcript_49583/g.91466 Transcript_49583/m.91466 type:complete len:317 (-) Transcript_49583:45-995(-)
MSLTTYTNRPYDYGSAAKPENLIDVEKPGAGFPMRGKSDRRRLNLMAILCAVLVPWMVYATAVYALSFRVHFNHPLWALSIAILALGFTCCTLWMARKEFQPNIPKTWYSFIAISCLVAWGAGLAVGDFIYGVHTRRGYELQTLNTYPGVDPSTQSGEEVMDAGRIIFKVGSRLDLKRSMGFKNSKVYCVAPIVLPGADAPVSYDFWAVGSDCCSGLVSDFHCGEYSNPKASAGVRLMDDESRAFYRLAVQQAEAMYGIVAAHPLFFEWVQDPVQVVQNFKEEGDRLFHIWMWCHLLLQTFAVVCACLYFSKDGVL